MSKAQSNRDLRLDFLKILAMISIVFIHVVNYGGAFTHLVSHPFMNALLVCMFSLGYAMTNVFVIVSAWMLTERTTRPRKILHLSIKASVYAVVIYTILCLIGDVPFGVMDLLRNLFAIFTRQYWFLTAYAVMYLIAPYLNKALLPLDKKDISRLLLVVLSVTSFIPSVLLFFPGRSLVDPDPGMTFMWLVALYILVYYVKIYKMQTVDKLSTGALVLCIFACVVLLAASRLALSVLSLRMGMDGAGSWRLFFNSSIPVVFLSFSIFMLALRLPESFGQKSRSVLLAFSSSTIGVYLITSQPQLLEIIGTKVGIQFTTFPDWTVPLAVLLTLILFVLSSVLEMMLSHVK